MTLTQSVLILYGTQTGTSQEVGERISRQLQRNHIPNRVLSIDQYDKTQLIRESCCLFIVATTGQGEIPYSMKEFWKFLLRKGLPQDILSQLKFSVFGLGDSSYEFFNVVGKKLYKRVLQLGASSIFPFGSGDDQHYLGYDGGLKGWSEGVLEVLKDIYPTDKAPLQTEVCLEPSWKLNPIANESLSDTQNHMIMDDNPGWISMKVINNSRITPNDHFQESRDLVLEFNDSTTK
jgi:sulfite reductase alpha subunit-like flavoprotein